MICRGIPAPVGLVAIALTVGVAGCGGDLRDSNIHETVTIADSSGVTYPLEPGLYHVGVTSTNNVPINVTWFAACNGANDTLLYVGGCRVEDHGSLWVFNPVSSGNTDSAIVDVGITRVLTP